MINLNAMDMGLSIGFFAIFALFGSLDYATVFNLAPFMNETAITVIGLLLLTGAMAKSAQIPLHSWLPGSMEGLNNLKLFNLNSYIYIYFYMASYFFITSGEINFTDLAVGWSRVSDVFSGVIYMSSMKFSTQIGSDSRGRFKKK